MRLLVIEDNQSLVANLFDYFEARGHVLDVAPDGITGLHLAATQSYDVIVLDWMLPRMDGQEVLRCLREKQDSGVPVIMLTARDELPDKIAGFRAGAEAVRAAGTGSPHRSPAGPRGRQEPKPGPGSRGPAPGPVHAGGQPRRTTAAPVSGLPEVAGNPDAGQSRGGTPATA